MTNIEKWLSIIGAIASIGGALWALYQAGQASKSATRAEEVRDEIIDRRKLVEISQVHSETNRILEKVSKVGPSCNPSVLRGVNCASIASEVEEYTRFITEQSSHFTEFFENRALELCKDIEKDIELLSEAKTFEEKKTFGKNIYYKIRNFLPTVKDLTDSKKENSK